MTGRNRREWRRRFYDHMAAEAAHLKGMLIRLIRERPRPRQEGGNRGRPPVRSEMGRRRFGFAGRPFHADRGRDAAANA